MLLLARFGMSKGGSVEAINLNGYAIFGGGEVLTKYTDKYLFSNNVVAPGTALGLARLYLAGCGNTAVGIFGGGTSAAGTAPGTTNYTDIYTHASNTVSVGTLLGSVRHGLAACGNSTLGIFAGGYSGSGGTPTTYTDKYTYTNNTVIPGIVLITKRYQIASAADSNMGIFIGGSSSSGQALYSTEKYTFSANTLVSSTLLSVARTDMAATGNSLFGVFGAGSTASAGSGGIVYNTTDKYYFSNGTILNGVNLGVKRAMHAAAGNSSIGIFTGGTPTNYTDRFMYSANTVISGTLLFTARIRLGALSSSPGGF